MLRSREALAAKKDKKSRDIRDGHDQYIALLPHQPPCPGVELSRQTSRDKPPKGNPLSRT